MFQRQGSGSIICSRHHAISLLFTPNDRLLEFFFTEDREGLRWKSAAATLRKANGYLELQDGILVRLALSIWLDSGHARFADIYSRLDDFHIECVQLAIDQLAQTKGCDCQSCRQRHTLAPTPYFPSALNH